MTGTIKKMLNEIYTQRAGGDQAIIRTLNVKLVLKGVYPDIYSDSSPDDEVIIGKVKKIAEEMGVEC